MGLIGRGVRLGTGEGTSVGVRLGTVPGVGLGVTVDGGGGDAQAVNSVKSATNKIATSFREEANIKKDFTPSF